jgi:hypothetical protein
MNGLPQLSLRGSPYANVVKEWFKLPGGASMTRQVFPRAKCGHRKPNESGPYSLARRLQNISCRTRKDPPAMDNSLLVSLSHQLASYRAMDVIANNIANASTPGFKREAAKFEEFVAMMRPAEGQTGLQPSASSRTPA